MKCKNCGYEAAEVKFCPQCGTEMKAQTQPVEQEPSQIIKSSPVVMSEAQFVELGITIVEQAFEKAGMTQVDRKHLAFPGMTDAEVDQMQKLSGKEKCALAVRALMNPRGAEPAAVKALSEGTDSAGGYLIPADFTAEIIKGLEKPNTWRSLISVEPTSRDAGTQPNLQSSVTVSRTAESTTISDSDPSFGVFSWGITKLAGLTYMSRELQDDNMVNLGDFLLQLFVEAIIRKEREEGITGTGTAEPTGLQNAAGITAVAQAGANFALVDVNAIYYALPSQYRASAVWVIHDDVMQLADNLVDGNGRPILNTNVADGTPARLKGRPVAENEYIPTDLGGGSNESLIFFGDLKRGVLMKDRQMISVEVSTEAGDTFAKHQAAVKVITRNDSGVNLSEAIVKGTGIK